MHLAEALAFTRDTPRAWHMGTVATVDGRQSDHSAWLAACGDKRHIDRRLWAAQASVLMGRIEELRVALLPMLRSYLRPPFTIPGGGVVHRVEDLEIGRLWHHLRATSIPESVQSRVGTLREYATQPLTPELALSDALLDVD